MRMGFAWSPADQHDTALMEQRLFQQVYDRETPGIRVNRIEAAVYGTSRTGTPEQRLSALRQALPNTAATPKPHAQTAPANAHQSQSAVPPHTQAPTRPGSESDYPVLDEMEQRVLGRVYHQDDITQRVPRLETQVYGQPLTGDLSNRVDTLRTRVLGNTPQAQEDNAMGYNNDEPTGQTPTDITITPDQVIPVITRMEQQLLKQTYPNEPVPNRLSRLETRVFNKTAPAEYTPEQRTERLVTVAGAGGQSPASTRSTAANVAIQLAPILIMMLPLII
jgi:hypothetical protein